MPVRTIDRYDLGWRRGHAAALLVFCALAAGSLALRALERPGRVFSRVPVYPRRVATARERIDPNTASAASLQRLRGIGPKLAAAIVAYRRGRPAPAFRTPEDLQTVHRIGPGTVRGLRAHLRLPDAGTQP